MVLQMVADGALNDRRLCCQYFKMVLPMVEEGAVNGRR
jgi:hypothetical protein